jgi:type I restriction enzyme S subunit
MTELPAGWEIKHLEDLCEPGKQAIVDGPFGSNLKRSDYVDSGVPVLKIQNIKENVITLKKMDYVKPEKYQELVRHSFTQGDIVMTKLGDPLGVSAIVDGIPNGLIVADLVRIRASKILTKFLCYQLNSPRIQKHINEQQKGTTRPRVNLAMIRGLPIYTPSIDEQHKIVELLEDHLSRLDAALTDVKQARIKSAQFRQSLLNSVFYGYKFKSVSLGDCIELIMGQAPPGITCNKNGEGTPFVKVGEFAKLYPTIEEWTIKPLRLAKKGDVLICVVGATVGKINLGIDCAIGRSVAAIRPKNTLLQKYLYYFLELKMLEIRGQSKGSAQGVITKDYINSIQIPLPELKAQQDVLDLLELNFSQIEKSIEVSNIIEHDSLSLRRSLLQAAFTGQLAKEVVSV